MAKRPLKNLDDGFTVYLYTIPLTFYFQIFVISMGGNVNDKKYHVKMVTQRGLKNLRGWGMIMNRALHVNTSETQNLAQSRNPE